MSFKKIKPEVIEAFTRIELTSIEGDAAQYFNAIKSGKNTCVTSTESSDRSLAAFVSIFNKVNVEYEGSPRAIYLTHTINDAEAFYKKASIVCRKLDITVDLVHDKGNMVQQRNDIFDGTEIIVGNPKRIFEMYLQNGINLKLIELFIVDNLDECIKNTKQGELKRLVESLENKTQIVFMTNAFTPKVEAFIESLGMPFFMMEAN